MWKSASYVTQYSSILLHKYVICVWYKAAMYMPQVALLVKLFASTNTQTHSEINQIKMRKQTQQSQNHKRAATLRFRDTEAYNLQKLKKFTWSTHTNEFSTPSPGGISGVNTPNFCTYPWLSLLITPPIAHRVHWMLLLQCLGELWRVMTLDIDYWTWAPTTLNVAL